MKKEHLKYLRCPKSKLPLFLDNNNALKNDSFRIKSGVLLEPVNGMSYPIIDYIPRFVEQNNYANSFGLEWNKHSNTQVDHLSGLNISEERFFNETKWENKLSGEIILEVGSGSGRFTAQAVSTEALIVSIDYSNAVLANYKNNGHHDNLLIVQANVFELPFENNYFDKVFCFGVLQHTPNPKLAFKNLVKSIKPGGRLATDIYLKSFTQVVLTPKYLIRIFTKKMNPNKLYILVTKYINFIWPFTRMLSKIPYVGTRLNWRLMVADYSDFFNISDNDVLKDMAILDTFDMLSPRYDLPVTKKTFLDWHIKENLKNIEVHYGYNGIEARSIKSLL